MNLSQWHSTATDNNTASPNGFPENMLPSGVNDSARELMAGVRRWYEDAQWLNFGDTPTFATTASFTLAGNKKDTYETGRRIKAYDATTLYGTISDSTYSTVTTVNVSLDSGELSSSLSSVAVGILSLTNSSYPNSFTPIYSGRIAPDGTAISMPSGWTSSLAGGSTYIISSNISPTLSKVQVCASPLNTVSKTISPRQIQGSPMSFKLLVASGTGTSQSCSLSFIVAINP